MCRRVKEMLSKGFTEAKRHWLIAIANLVIWVGAGVFSYIIWIFGGGRVTFGPLSSYIFIWLSIVIAITAALNSGIASVVASRSLELTRSTTRPFLMSGLGVEFTGNVARIHVRICNTGIHPADNASVDVQLFTLAAEDSREQILRQRYYPGVIIFPNEEIWYALGVASKHVEIVKTEQAYVRVSINYQYKITGKQHATVRTDKISKDPFKPSRFIFLLTRDKSYWY